MVRNSFLINIYYFLFMKSKDLYKGFFRFIVFLIYFLGWYKYFLEILVFFLLNIC